MPGSRRSKREDHHDCVRILHKFIRGFCFVMRDCVSYIDQRGVNLFVDKLRFAAFGKHSETAPA